MMQHITIGFIGAGNMGTALMRSMAGKKCMEQPIQLICYDIVPQACEKAYRKFGAEAKSSISALVKEADMIWVAVKPQFLEEILPELKENWTKQKVLASIVAGKSTVFWEGVLGEQAQIARIMPNTPAFVGEAMNTVCFSQAMKSAAQVVALLQHTGRVMEIRENLMDAAMGVAGCGPAFVYMFIEALADAGVAEGLFRPQAYELAAQTVLGAAKMVLETGEHPGALKDAVCSPGGTTIQGVMALEKGAFRGTVQQAVAATIERVRKE
ncbi:MAG: pyrroline-5-carboxylate reductase [Lachnospiraceae bacterium]|jgi:pyrroline-5-carboxylate reductase|nr:pyrroline-5-carboxylate reductase [Lachnospiraceae bacterium]